MLEVVSTPPRYLSFKILGLADNMSFGSLRERQQRCGSEVSRLCEGVYTTLRKVGSDIDEAYSVGDGKVCSGGGGCWQLD